MNKRGGQLAPRLEPHAPIAYSFLHRARRRLVVDRRPQNGAGMSVPADKPFLWLLGKAHSRFPRLNVPAVALDRARIESRGLGLTNIRKLASPRCRPSISQPNPCMLAEPYPRPPLVALVVAMAVRQFRLTRQRLAETKLSAARLRSLIDWLKMVSNKLTEQYRASKGALRYGMAAGELATSDCAVPTFFPLKTSLAAITPLNHAE